MMSGKVQAKAKPDSFDALAVSGMLQRKCDCGQHTIAGGECDECGKKHLSLQRASRNSGLETRNSGGVPPIVHDVLRSPGQPLDAATRAFMEPRFGHDFSHVRVHTDAPAAKSARAVNALAYTVGQEIVFGSGQYLPGTTAGNRLLAHELTHVAQQQPGLATKDSLTLGHANDSAEQEADRVGEAVLAGQPVLLPGVASGQGAVIRRLGRDSDTPAPAPPGPSQPAPGPTCGPDVTSQVSGAVAKAKTTFAGWSNTDKRSACDALDSLSTGAVAWDIVELHNNAWILTYRPACASQGATPPCGSTVQVGTDCHYAGSPNYVIYGVMCKLCNAHFTAISDAPAAARFTQAKMEYWVNIYKGTGFTGLATPSGNYGPSRDWAIAGYNGWPSGGAAPGGDRNTCAPNCPTPYGGGAFQVNWVPHGAF